MRMECISITVRAHVDIARMVNHINGDSNLNICLQKTMKYLWKEDGEDVENITTNLI